MKRIFATFFLCFIFSMHPNLAYCETEDIEQHVRNFYRWYIAECVKQKKPVNSNFIYTYVSQCVINNIRIYYKRGYYDADYFTKSQDIWKEWLDKFTIQDAVNVDETTSIVPITFILSENLQNQLVVFVKKEKEGLRIIKIVDTLYFE